MGFLLIDTNETIVRKINAAYLKKIKSNFSSRQNISIIENIVRDFVTKAIKNTYTWQSLQGVTAADGFSLVGHFGIPKGSNGPRLDELLSIWSNEIVVQPQTIDTHSQVFKLKYKFYAIEADWANVLASPAGVSPNDSPRSRKGESPTLIPWLEWLLVAGDQIEIKDFTINRSSGPGSRSGEAVMIKINSLTWKVPAEFAPFSTDNNFVTRALAKLVEDAKFKNDLTNEFKNFGVIDYSPSTLYDLGGIDLSDLI